MKHYISILFLLICVFLVALTPKEIKNDPKPELQQVDTSILIRYNELYNKMQDEKDRLLTVELEMFGYEGQDWYRWSYDENFQLKYGETQSEVENMATSGIYFFQEGKVELIVVTEYFDEEEDSHFSHKDRPGLSYTYHPTSGEKTDMKNTNKFGAFKDGVVNIYTKQTQLIKNYLNGGSLDPFTEEDLVIEVDDRLEPHFR